MSRSLLTQNCPQPDRDLVRKLSIRPEEIEYSDLIQWVSDNTSYSVGAPANARREQPIRFSFAMPLAKEPPSFKALSSCPAIAALADRRVSEMLDRDTEGGTVLGRTHASTVCKINTRPYA